MEQERLKGTSFANWIHYPFSEPFLVGEVSLTLVPDEPVLYISHRLISKANLYVRYIRGPWLKVGECSFGSRKTDAIFPGVEWLIGDEWSSGTDWFKDPWALRFAPHPNKVSIPVMACSYDGDGIGMAWDPNREVTGWFNYRRCCPQPVFASPNFVDRMNNHLMGLMVPDAEIEALENRVYAEPPLELHLDQEIEFDAEIFISRGNSLQVLVDWVKRHGLPGVPLSHEDFRWTLDRIADAYNTRFWYEEKGFGNEQHPDGIGPNIPLFLERYIRENDGKPTAMELKKKIEWCQKQGKGRSRDIYGRIGLTGGNEREKLLEEGKKILSWQREDGSFGFEPDGRHYMKDDFVVARSFIEPMGLAHDTALDICAVPAIQLLRLWEKTGVEAFKEGARKALEYCMPMTRPEGGDFWETPLHSPNLLAAGHGAIAYYLGYKVFGDERYRQKAIYWLRSLLPFTHLWETEQVRMLYNTKPCLCSSDWYFANWVRDHVQWEVLETFAASVQLGIDWGEVDPEVDWHLYHEGITSAAIRWVIDHRDNKWKPHNMPWTLKAYKEGRFDGCFPDTHNTTTGNYGGMVIMPDVIAVNIYGILDYGRKDI